MDAEHALQWEDDMAQYQGATIALGHILEFRVRWRSNGYSLGTVAKTLTLAPRQTKRIQKIEWQRTESARRRELTQLFDQETRPHRWHRRRGRIGPQQLTPGGRADHDRQRAAAPPRRDPPPR